MRFAEPDYLWLLLAIPLFALLGWWIHGRRRRALRLFAGGEAHIARFNEEVSINLRATKLLLLLAAVGALSVALARPQWGTRIEPVTRRGADLAIVLDTSLSMAAEDLAPNRLVQARQTIDSLLASAEGDRVALVTFAGQAHLSCPLTVDHGAVRLFLDAVDIEAVPVPGTALAEALGVALDALEIDRVEAEDRGRVILLFTDGEDHEGGLEEAIGSLSDAGVSVYAVGSGTARGAPIPVADGSGAAAGYKKDREGMVVTSRLDEAVLEQIALETGGHYYRATASGVEVEQIARALEGLNAGEIGTQVRTRYEERFQIVLLIGVVALLAETLVGDRRRRSGRSVPADEEVA